MGGGSSGSKPRTMKESNELSFIADCPEASVWTTSKVATTTETSRVDPEASYTFVRELKRSVARDDKTVSSFQVRLRLGHSRRLTRRSTFSPQVLHHLPVFEEPRRTHKFDRKNYEEEFSHLEYSLPLDRPRSELHSLRSFVSSLFLPFLC